MSKCSFQTQDYKDLGEKNVLLIAHADLAVT